MNRPVSETDELARLRGLPLFAGLGDDALRRIHALGAEIEVPAGQMLVQAGDAASGMFVIEEGSVVVEARGSIEIELGPGEFVGELALLVPDSVRSARVRARTDVRCLAIGADDFRGLLDDEPRIALAMLPVVAERLWRVRQG
jgi:CRP/FNR family transcriptional regulator, cyclic AMP receptor protein